MKTLLPMAFLTVLLHSVPAQTILYVDQNASGNADGSSWTNAFIRLQQALAVAQDGDEIWVAKGTYYPTTTDNRTIYYDLPSGVALYGGFASGETQLTQRDWVAHPTILSGDIGVPGDSTDNSFNVLYSYSPNEKTRLDGFVVEEGNATNSDNSVDYHRPTRSGGGLYLDGEHFGYAELSVAHCIFRHNRALYEGGGLYANGREGGMAIVRLEDCRFEQNRSNFYGGGLSLENYFEQPYALEIKDCVFQENHCITGAAVYLSSHQPVTVSRCRFSRNVSIYGTIISFTGTEYKDPIQFIDCLFEDNNCETVVFWDAYLTADTLPIDISRCRFNHNLGTPIRFFVSGVGFHLKVENSEFLFNGGYLAGQAVYSSYSSELSTSATFKNCLFYKGYGTEFIGKVDSLVNCIVVPELPDQLIVLNSSLYIQNCLLSTPSCAGLGTDVTCGPGNLYGLDPLFLNPSPEADADFHLQPCSPAINAGREVPDLLTDLEGNPRVRNGKVDLGPYETLVSLHPAVSALPACAGASNGAIELSPDICPPYSLVWSNGLTTGTNTAGLAAGTYVFMATGSNLVPVSDTIEIQEPAPVVVQTMAQEVTCFGSANGLVSAQASGGTPGYTYTWDGILTPFNLPPGTYSVTATDAQGCTGSAQAIVGSPEPIEVFYTVYPATCMGCSNGSIVFDSIAGGTNPSLPASMINLSPGNYSITLTDAAGCFQLLTFTVGFTTETREPEANAQARLWPNPTPSGEQALLEWLGEEPAIVRVLDAQGKVLQQHRLPAKGTVFLEAVWPAGVYQLEIFTDSGTRTLRCWLIL